MIDFKVGQTYRAKLGLKIYKIHILGIFDEDMIAYKYYGKHKQWWHYYITDRAMLEVYIEHSKTHKTK
jgi:hypothetical protein